MIDVKVYSASDYPLPKYESEMAAGLDVYACIDEPIVLGTLDRVKVPTGLYIELPVGYECQVRPRSGLALNHGISIVNSPGTVDADYRGEIGVILINMSKNDFTITPGMKIAQIVFNKYEICNFVPVSTVEELSKTERGDGGYGHTDNK